MAITAPESTGTVTLTIDGREVSAAEGSTIWEAAKAAGIDIPVLCHDERYNPVESAGCAWWTWARPRSPPPAYGPARTAPGEDGQRPKSSAAAPC